MKKTTNKQPYSGCIERFKNFYRGGIRERSLRDAEPVVTRATAPHSCAARVKREEPDPLWQPSFI